MYASFPMKYTIAATIIVLINFGVNVHAAALWKTATAVQSSTYGAQTAHLAIDTIYNDEASVSKTLDEANASMEVTLLEDYNNIVNIKIWGSKTDWNAANGIAPATVTVEDKDGNVVYTGAITADLLNPLSHDFLAMNVIAKKVTITKDSFGSLALAGVRVYGTVTTAAPTGSPTLAPTAAPASPPTNTPSSNPTLPPTLYPTKTTASPSYLPTIVPSTSPSFTPSERVDPTTSPTNTPSSNVCSSLKTRNKCNKNDACEYGKKKNLKKCFSKVEYDCSQYPKKSECVKKGVCSFVDDVCVHKCYGLGKGKCKRKKSKTKEKICLYDSYKNPCYKCNPKSCS